MRGDIAVVRQQLTALGQRLLEADARAAAADPARPSGEEGGDAPSAPIERQHDQSASRAPEQGSIEGIIASIRRWLKAEH
jgi:hypothetical protein